MALNQNSIDIGMIMKLFVLLFNIHGYVAMRYPIDYEVNTYSLSPKFILSL